MSIPPPPPFIPMGPPPLPPGWSEYRGPNGQPYYYNTQTQESTYVRPLPSFPIAPPQPVPPPAPPQKKEKPKLKTPIPGTDWLRVITTEGNTFYTNKATKKSVWTVPEEIKDVLAALDKEEEEENRKVKEAEEAAEVEKIRKEVKDMVGKRKAEGPVPVDEVVISKKARVDDEEENEGDEDEDEEDEDEESDEEEEEWQREAAEQLAREAEEHEKQRQEEERLKKEEEERAKKELKEAETRKGKGINMPERVDLSMDEAKALFKNLLREKDINPLHPWDTSLPLFVSDPRYVLLPSVAARREAFDEYCKDRARELRQLKQAQAKKDNETLSPKEEFDRLLKEEVKSTRTSWTEWRRAWKKDRRFNGWGRDDREREKRFREYLKDLGEKKRAAAEQAEKDFFSLLKESGIAKPGVVWKEVKKDIVSDPRYDAVGSSSLREELFNTYLKARSSKSEDPESTTRDHSAETSTKQSKEDKEHEKKQRKEQAVKDREAKVRVEQGKVQADINKSRQGLNKEEGESEFRTMLTDAIRDPQMTWDDALPQLKTDPRFTRSPLPFNHQLHLFHDHVNQLRSKQLASLHALFQSHAPSLSMSFGDLPVSSLLSSPPATRLGFDIRRLENEFDKWQGEKYKAARRDFDEMLRENAFVEFWGRLGKIGGKGVDETIKADDIGEDAEEIVDMKQLAKTVDLNEIVKVLKNDNRYLSFEHLSEEREQWLREYLSKLSAPKLSVHVPET